MTEYVETNAGPITKQVYDEMVVPWQQIHEAAMEATALVMRRYLDAFTDEQIISGDCDAGKLTG